MTDAVYITPREMEVVTWITAGKTSAVTGEIMGLAPCTIETYKQRLMDRLGVPNVAALVAFAFRRGWVE